MPKLIIYGNTGSRTARVLWLAEELGLDYRQVDVRWFKEAKSAEHRARNPMAAVPVIDDDGFVLWESMAINLYLIRKHGGPLAPADPQAEARATQWSFWVVSECEPWMLSLFGLAEADPADTAKADARERAIKRLDRPLAALETSLEGRDYLLGDHFTVADLNVASVFAWGKQGGLDFSTWPQVEAWLGRCFARPRMVVDADPENW